MGLYDYKSKGSKTKDRETMTLKFCPARKTTEEKTIYRAERIVCQLPSEFTSTTHSVFILWGIKKQDSDYKMSSCSEQGTIKTISRQGNGDSETSCTPVKMRLKPIAKPAKPCMWQVLAWTWRTGTLIPCCWVPKPEQQYGGSSKKWKQDYHGIYLSHV